MKAGAAICLFLLLGSFGLAHSQVPLPPDLSIADPSPDVPAEEAAFSGAWGNGAWDGTVPTALIVERVHANGSASVIYAVGASPQANIQPEWLRLQGRIASSHLIVQNLPHGGIARYTVGAQGHLIGTYTTTTGARSHVVLQRIAGASAGIVGTAALPVQPIWRDIRIPEHSKIGAAAGQTIELQATLYRTRLPGRQPLVVLNHGSGYGDYASRVLRFEGEARVFLALGYNVVVPMRKGRGRSGGPVLEQMAVKDTTAVASGLEDIDTVVDFMRGEPWVDPARIVVAGWSRGGFLSVAYAARYPEKVEGVINFSGGWWPEFGSSSDAIFNTAQLANAGRSTKVPQLWLYAADDRFYMLDYCRRNFDAFRANGGQGEFVAFHDIPVDGHLLFEWVGRWKHAVADYLRQADRG